MQVATDMGRWVAILLVAFAWPTLARGDSARALERSCEAGDPSACLTRAEQLEKKGDLKKAARSYGEACEGNIARACTRAGTLLDAGKSLRPNYPRAAEYFERGCKLQDGTACRNLSTMHYTGRGVRRSMARALELLERACNFGHAAACDNLARIYFTGNGVKRDKREAERYGRMACEGGYEQACGRVKGVSSPVGEERANRALGGCDGGDSLSCVTLGYMYSAGLGVGQDETRAAELFDRACEEGEATGCRFLAGMYERGQGVHADSKRAKRLAKRACRLDGSCQEEVE
jgi:TPR repeat protein